MYLNIDKQKVLNSKIPKIDPLTESFNVALNEQTPLNIINFMSLYRQSSKDTILENLSNICDINSDITFAYFNHVLEVSDLSNTILTSYRDHLSQICIDNDDYQHVDRLHESIDKIDSIMENNNDINVIKEDVLMGLAIDRIKRSCVFESYLEDELEVLIYNMNTSPETITEYEKIIRKIKTSRTSEYFSSFPMLLVKNTEMIRSLNIQVSGDVLDLLTCMPLVIANKLVETEVSQSVLKSYIKIYEKQIATMYQALKNNEPSQYRLFSAYVRNLIEAKNKITTGILQPHIDRFVKQPKVLHESTNVDEGIADMCPDILMYDEAVVEDLIAELEDSIADIVFDPGEEIDEAKLENFASLCRTYEATTNVQKKMISAGHKAGKSTQKAVSNLKSNIANSNRAKLPIIKAMQPLANLITGTLEKIKKIDKKERAERIITGGFKGKLSNYIRKGIKLVILGVTAKTVGKTVTKATAGATMKAAGKLIAGMTIGKFVGILLAAIGIYAAIAHEKKVDRKVRQEVLIDLKNELEIVNEKIKDAESDNARKDKYELMRIQQKLKKDIERIEYNLD